MRFNTDASATYKKLDNGTWGVWTYLELRPGQSVRITTRSGQKRLERVKSKINFSLDGKYTLLEHKESKVRK